MTKKFLVPVATAVAALAANGQANAVQPPSSEADVAQQNQKPSPLLNRADAQRVIFSTGEALHSLVLARNGQGVLLADHESHYSHSSHASHSSHYSGN